MTRVHLTLRSENRKTGKIPVSMTTSDSCPTTCPFKEKGCYGGKGTGPLNYQWTKLDDGRLGGMDWEKFCHRVASLPDGQIWRHNQVGDLPHRNGKVLRGAVNALCKANTGKDGFTYTHHEILSGPHAEANLGTLLKANREGFTINASADNLEQADQMRQLGMPTVVVLPKDGPYPRTTPAGRRIVVCPNPKTGIQCVDCKLCAKPDRKSIVGFPAHGRQYKAVELVCK